MGKLINGAKEQVNLNTIILGVCAFLAVRYVNGVDDQIKEIQSKQSSIAARLIRIEDALKVTVTVGDPTKDKKP